MAKNLAPSNPALLSFPLPLDDVPNIAQEIAIFGTFRRQEWRKVRVDSGKIY